MALLYTNVDQAPGYSEVYADSAAGQILTKNPDKDPNQYEEEDLQHMRKVVSYCKRHLAQEEKAKQNTDSKSYKSLKNWGHDPLKT